MNIIEIKRMTDEEDDNSWGKWWQMSGMMTYEWDDDFWWIWIK